MPGTYIRYPSTTGSGTGDVVGPASSADGQIALFSGATGKVLKVATGTGVVKATSGVYSTSAIGDLTDAGTDGITVTGGTGSVIGSGTSIAQHVADGTHNGYLSSTDWTTFNAKQAALTIGNLTDAGTDGITVTGGTGAIIGSGTSLAQHVADTTHNGYLSSTDWNTFNGKQTGTLTSAHLFVGNGSNVATDVAVSGDLTLANTGAFSIGAGKVTNTMLAGSIQASKLVGTDIATVGTVTAGTWHSTAIGALYGGTGGDSSGSTGIAHVAAGTWSYAAVNLANSDVTGTLGVGNGGTGQASNWTSKGVIFATSTTALASASAGSAGQVFMSNGASSPAMASVPGNTTILKAPTVQTFLTGGGSGTYTLPTNPAPIYIVVESVAAGGGGGGTGSGAGDGSAGGNSTFHVTGGGTLIVSSGGGGGKTVGTGGSGGAGSLGSGPIGQAVSGGDGATAEGAIAHSNGGSGGSSALGGAGTGGAEAGLGNVGKANTGGGAGGSGLSGGSGSGGGGAGGYVKAIITSPSSSYDYAVGSGGTGGSGGSGGRGGVDGGTGGIWVWEFYQ